MPQIYATAHTLHVITAIVAFGPSFAFPLISRMSAQEPQHGLFALRLIELIEKRLILPAALTMPITGFIMVWAGSIDLLATHWLVAGIALYVVAITFSLAVQVPTIARMVQVALGMQSGAAAPSASMPAGVPRLARAPLPAGPGAKLAGPPPEMAALGKRAQRGGILLSLLIVAIVSLMVLQPTF